MKRGMSTTDWLLVAAIVGAGAYALYRLTTEAKDDTPDELPADTRFFQSAGELAVDLVTLDLAGAGQDILNMGKSVGDAVTPWVAPFSELPAQFQQYVIDPIDDFFLALLYGERVTGVRQTVSDYVAPASTGSRRDDVFPATRMT